VLLGELHVVLDADICHFAETRMSEDIFHAELANGDEIIIEGVKTINRMCRLISILAGCIVLASVIAVGAAMIASRLLAVPPPPSAAPHNDSGLFNENETTMNATGALPSNEYLNSNEAGNTLSSFVGTDSGKVILQMLNRTDTNFTHFGISSDAAILEGTDLMLITKMITPLWNGHALDALESLNVEGQSLVLADMCDGMVLTSIAGYPLRIQLDPFRVNNVSISATDRDLRFKNGITHILLHYPIPLVPWIGKSSFDVLLEINTLRSGDLSTFIGLVRALPNLKSQLLLQQGDSKAITLFVPTNEAFGTSDASTIIGAANDSQALENYVLHHVVSGNFVRRCWWTIPTGTKVSDTELMLESQAALSSSSGGVVVLQLKINTVNVTINGYATIIQEDIFSEQGILHVIDKPLSIHTS